MKQLWIKKQSVEEKNDQIYCKISLKLLVFLKILKICERNIEKLAKRGFLNQIQHKMFKKLQKMKSKKIAVLYQKDKSENKYKKIMLIAQGNKGKIEFYITITQ